MHDAQRIVLFFIIKREDKGKTEICFTRTDGRDRRNQG